MRRSGVDKLEWSILDALFIHGGEMGAKSLCEAVKQRYQDSKQHLDVADFYGRIIRLDEEGIVSGNFNNGGVLSFCNLTEHGQNRRDELARARQPRRTKKHIKDHKIA